MAHEAWMPEDGQMDAVWPSGQACAERMDGAGIYVACQHTGYSGDACALQAGLQQGHGRPAAEWYKVCSDGT